MNATLDPIIEGMRQIHGMNIAMYDEAFLLKSLGDWGSRESGGRTTEDPRLATFSEQ